MYKKLLFLLPLFLLFSISLLFAQEEQQTKGTDEPSSAEAPVRLVTSIEIQGNKNISSNTVISKMKTRVGSPYLENVISDDLKRLYLLGFFSDIKIDTQDYKEGLKIIITVAERPIIEKVTFSGMHRLMITEEKLKAQLKSKEGQYLDYPTLAEDMDALKAMYEKKGFGEVLINHDIKVDPQTNKASLEFAVIEGKKLRIKDIYVQGNKVYSAKRILKLIKTKRAWFFNAGALKEEVLEEDMERIKSFYHKGGYADVEVANEVKQDPNPRKPFLYVYISIKEGKKYLVGNLFIRGNEKISQKEILASIKECLPGKIFSEEALKEDIASIQGIYFDRGYIFAQIQDTTSLNTSNGRIDIAYDVRESDLAYVDKIKIRGNVKTKDVVIRRELRIKPGDKFDGEKLRRSKERLQNLGYFDEISYDTEESPQPDKKDLVVEVKEAKTGAFSFGGGYSSVDKLVGFVEVEQKNFDWKNFPYFTGAGQNLKFRATLGTITENFELSYTDPWVFDYPVSFGFDAYKRTHKRESDVGYGYDEDVTGGDLRLGKELTEYVRTDLMYRIDQIEITNIDDSASSDLKSEFGRNVVSSMRWGLTYDSRNSVFDTTKGELVSGSIEMAGGPFGGDKDFYKFFGRASHYQPLPKNSVIEFRGRVGIADTYSDTEKIPIYERFFAGGSSTIRGYRERKAGPVDRASSDPLGGNSLLIGNIEYTYPLFNFLRVATFYDVGNVWEKANDIGSGGFKSSIGLGVRIRTPIGPVMLDYGIPFNKESGEESKSKGRFHFSMSNSF